MKSYRGTALLGIGALLNVFSVGIPAQAASVPVLKNATTVIGTTYCIDQDFEKSLGEKVSEIRSEIRAQRAKGKFVGYISVPLSPAGGGSADINKRVSGDVKRHLETTYGDGLWMLAPSSEEANIPSVNGKQPRGQEYMYMWTQVLAGEDGLGRDFELFYFTGPSDFWRALQITASNSIGALEALAAKEGLTGEKKRDFVSYYTFRASVNASKGAHDEWNILRLINSARRVEKSLGTGAQIASFYNGQPVDLGDAEAPVSAGYEGTCK